MRFKLKSFLKVFFVLFLINIFVGGIATEYVVEFWGSYFKNTMIDVPFALCVVAGLFLGEFTVPLAAITLLVSFFF